MWFRTGVLFVLISGSGYAEKISVVLDWYMNPNHAVLYTAQKYGFFKKKGLDVKIVEPSDGQAGPKMVAMGKIDLALTYQYHFHLFRKQGLPLIHLATLIPTPLNCLMVKAESGIKCPKDFKGKKIGYHVGLGTSQKFIETLLASAGLTLKDVTLIHAKNSLVPSFMTGQLDAITGGFRTAEPYKMLSHHIKVKVFAYEEYGVPSYEELIIIKRKGKTINPDFCNVLNEAVSYLKDNEAKILKDFCHDYPALDYKLTSRIWKATLGLFSDKVDLKKPALYKKFHDYLG